MRSAAVPSRRTRAGQNGMNAWVYILLCADGSYYVGSARGSLDYRIGQHQAGEMAGYTHSRRPVELVWSQDFQFITDAIAFERQLKGWSRAKKEALIRGEYDKLPALAARGFKPAVRCASSLETPRRSQSGGAPQDEAQGEACPHPEEPSSPEAEKASRRTRAQ